MFGLGIFAAVAGAVCLILCVIFKEKLSMKYNEKTRKMESSKRFVVFYVVFCAVIVLGIILAGIGSGTESFKRWQKDLESEYDGGLPRRIEVVDKDGEVLRSYEGNIDIQENNGEKIVFVVDGKKVIVYNTSIFNTVFVEEK